MDALRIEISETVKRLVRDIQDLKELRIDNADEIEEKTLAIGAEIFELLDECPF